eukprot:Gb_00355 [translate_table: standard]
MSAGFRGLSELWSIIDEDLLNSSSTTTTNDPLTYLWPMPKQSTNGNVTITVDPNLQLDMQGNSSNSSLVQDAFARLIISVSSADETLQLGTDESYSLYVPEGSGLSIIQDAVLEPSERAKSSLRKPHSMDLRQGFRTSGRMPIWSKDGPDQG